MRLRGMAPTGAARTVGRGPKGRTVECLTIRNGGAPARKTFVPVAGRSLVVCTALAAGVASALVGFGGGSGVTPAEAAVVRPTFMPRVAAIAPEPEAPATRFVPAVPEELTEQDLSEARADFARLDRVPLEYFLPQETMPGAALVPGPRVPPVAAAPTLDPDEVLEFGPMRVRRHVVETIVRAARATEADPVLLMAIADKESSFKTTVQARTSSATGLFQFIERTWLHVVREFGAKHGLEKEAALIGWDDDGPVVEAADRARILELRRDPYLSALMAAEMLKRDRDRIARGIGRDLTDGEVYLAHFLGPDDAERFLQKVEKQPKAVAARLLPRPARANRPIFYVRAGRKAKGRSVAEVHKKFEAMMDTRLERYRNVGDIPGLTAFAETPR